MLTLIEGALETFLEEDDGQAVVMLNLLRFQEEGGRERYADYLAAAAPILKSIAAHPGISRTDLLHNAPGRYSAQGLLRSILWFMFQPAAQGALPTLFAATSPEAQGGKYYGPDRLSETRGHPHEATIPAAALNLQVARRLWDVSETLANVNFAAAPATSLRA